MSGRAMDRWPLGASRGTARIAGLSFTVEGNGPALLFVHGFPTSGRLWSGIVARLRTRHTCVVVDLPGCGDSPAGDGGPLDAARISDALEAVRAALGLSSWAVVGHDAGAVVAVHYAAAHPARVDALGLMAAPLFGDFMPPPVLRLLRLPLLGDVVAPALVPALLHHLPRLLRDRSRTAMATVGSFGAPFRGFAGARRFLRLARWGDPKSVLGRTAALLGSLAVPTLVVHGAHDPVIPVRFAERAATAIPGARLAVVDAGHFTPIDRPEALARELHAFLAEHRVVRVPALVRPGYGQSDARAA